MGERQMWQGLGPTGEASRPASRASRGHLSNLSTGLSQVHQSGGTVPTSGVPTPGAATRTTPPQAFYFSPCNSSDAPLQGHPDEDFVLTDGAGRRGRRAPMTRRSVPVRDLVACEEKQRAKGMALNGLSKAVWAGVWAVWACLAAWCQRNEWDLSLSGKPCCGCARSAPCVRAGLHASCVRSSCVRASGVRRPVRSTLKALYRTAPFPHVAWAAARSCRRCCSSWHWLLSQLWGSARAAAAAASWASCRAWRRARLRPPKPPRHPSSGRGVARCGPLLHSLGPRALRGTLLQHAHQEEQSKPD